MKRQLGKWLKWAGRKFVVLGMRLDPPENDHLLDTLRYSAWCFAKPYHKAMNKDLTNEN